MRTIIITTHESERPHTASIGPLGLIDLNEPTITNHNPQRRSLPQFR